MANTYDSALSDEELAQAFMRAQTQKHGAKSSYSNLIAGGSSGDPVYTKAQGIARVLQGAIGGYLEGAEQRKAEALIAQQIAAGEQGMAMLKKGLGGATVAVPAAVAGGAVLTPVPPIGGAGYNAQGKTPSMALAGADAIGSKYGISPDYLSRTAWIESKHNPDAVSSTGATGVFQFTKGTAKQYGLTDRTDVAASTDAAARLAADNRQILQSRLGREPTDAELYLAHQQGAGGAASLLSNPDAPATSVVGSQAIAVNGGKPGMTAGQFASLWTNKYNSLGPIQGLNPDSPQARLQNAPLPPERPTDVAVTEPVSPPAMGFGDGSRALSPAFSGGNPGNADVALNLDPIVPATPVQVAQADAPSFDSATIPMLPNSDSSQPMVAAPPPKPDDWRTAEATPQQFAEQLGAAAPLSAGTNDAPVAARAAPPSAPSMTLAASGIDPLRVQNITANILRSPESVAPPAAAPEPHIAVPASTLAAVVRSMGGPDLSNTNDAGAGDFARSSANRSALDLASVLRTGSLPTPFQTALAPSQTATDAHPLPVQSIAAQAAPSASVQAASDTATAQAQPAAQPSAPLSQPAQRFIAGMTQQEALQAADLLSRSPYPGRAAIGKELMSKVFADPKVEHYDLGDRIIRLQDGQQAGSFAKTRDDKVDLGDSVGILQNGQLVSTIPKSKIPGFQVIGKDAYGNEQYGFVDPSNMRVVPTGPAGGGQVLPGQPGSTIPAPPPGVDPKIWREQQSKSATADALPVDPKVAAELRKEVLSLPSYKNLSQAAPIYRSMSETAGRNTKASDLNLVYGLGKIMDPGSVVREGEMVMVKNTASLPDWLVGAANTLNGGAALAPQTRQAIMTEGHSRMKAYEDQYDYDAKHYGGIAKRGRMALEDVVPQPERAQPWKPSETTKPDTTAPGTMRPGDSRNVGGATIRRVN